MSPTEEDTTASPTPSEGHGAGAEPVSVELPGCPSGAARSSSAATHRRSAPTSTGRPRRSPRAAASHIDAFGAPRSSASTPPRARTLRRASADFVFTAASGGCDVTVTWNGQALADPENPVLSATAATLTCGDQTTCDAAAASIAETGGAAIGLFVVVDEPPRPRTCHRRPRTCHRRPRTCHRRTGRAEVSTGEPDGRGGTSPAGDATPGSGGTPSATTFVAPASFFTAVLFYYGYVSSREQYRYFGLDVDTVGLSTRDYVMRSPQPLLVPVLLVTVIGALLILVSRCPREAGAGRPHQRGHVGLGRRPGRRAS